MASANCLAGCISRYASKQLIRPEAGHSLAPWVRIKFIGGGSAGEEITVGNESSPAYPHTAIVKNFEFAHSSAVRCRITINDERGGSFVSFVESLVKDLKNVKTSEVNMEVDFGWAKANCPGSSVKSSKKFYFLIENMTTSFSEGKIKFEIEGVDIPSKTQEARGDRIFGTDNNKMYLVDAIKEMFRSKPEPIVDNVEFVVQTAGGPKPLKWKVGDEQKGPLGVWTMAGNDKLTSARNWINQYVTDKNKGIKMIWDNTSKSGTLYFFEDPQPGCKEGIDWDSRSIGTYVVNGGLCSPVISFNPQIKWNFLMLGNQGGGKSNLTAEAIKAQGKEDCETLKRDRIEGGGITKAISPSENSTNNYAIGKDAEEVDKASTAHAFANPFIIYPIEAELQVIGDPDLPPPVDAFGKVAAIVVINPFWITPLGLCGEWLANPGCNPVLSNKAWEIKKISHSISDGRYVSTINVFLPVPGSTLDIGEPFGGQGSGGYTPKR